MLRERIYGECAHEQHVRRTPTLTLSYTRSLLTQWVEMSYVCAYSSVQLDKRRVEKEFTIQMFRGIILDIMFATDGFYC